jgi:hypothetical protein
MFPPSPLGAFTSNDARDLQQQKVELFVGEKRSDKFGVESDFHVILGILYMPQICRRLYFPSEGRCAEDFNWNAGYKNIYSIIQK